MNRENPSYKPCKFSTSNGDLSKQWFVFFSILNPETNQYERKKEYVSLKLNETERLRKMKQIKRSIDALLKQNKIAPTNYIPTPKSLSIKQALLLAKEYNHSKYNKRTAKVYNNSLDLIISEIGSTPINLMDSILIEDTLLTMQEKRAFGANRHNQIKAHLSSALKFLRRKRIITTIFTKDVENQKITESNTQTWSEDEVKTWFNYVHTNNHKLLVLSYLVYHCFIRIEEALRIRVKDVDTVEQLIHIPGDNSKNDKGNYVTISDALNEILIERIADKNPEDYLIGKKYQVGPETFLAQAAYDMAKRLKRKLNLGEHCTLYRLKHTGNTLLLNSGVNISDLQEQNRHSSQKQTETYARKLKGKANPIFKNLPKV
jgi:integrase